MEAWLFRAALSTFCIVWLLSNAYPIRCAPSRHRASALVLGIGANCCLVFRISERIKLSPLFNHIFESKASIWEDLGFHFGTLGLNFGVFFGGLGLHWAHFG